MPDLRDVLATDALLDALACGEPVDAHDPAVAPLTALAGLVREAPMPEADYDVVPEVAAGPLVAVPSRRPAGAGPLGSMVDRRFALRSLAAGVAVVGVVCTGGISAAVTGDPLYPMRTIIDHMAPGEQGKILPRLGGSADAGDETGAAEDEAAVTQILAPTTVGITIEGQDGQIIGGEVFGLQPAQGTPWTMNDVLSLPVDDAWMPSADRPHRSADAGGDEPAGEPAEPQDPAAGVEAPPVDADGTATDTGAGAPAPAGEEAPPGPVETGPTDSSGDGPASPPGAESDDGTGGSTDDVPADAPPGDGTGTSDGPAPTPPPSEPEQPDTPSSEPEQPDTPPSEPEQPDTPSSEPEQPDTPSSEPEQPADTGSSDATDTDPADTTPTDTTPTTQTSPPNATDAGSSGTPPEEVAAGGARADGLGESTQSTAAHTTPAEATVPSTPASSGTSAPTAPAAADEPPDEGA
ncbi:MAG TPA: anti-sigma-D factor RsdA [Nocardioidaceae bacterium]|nr:anti-sigma-D factor RsdA [Nocardioidaceae bacterium]